MITTIDDGMILDCYRLAAFYHVEPQIFLNMPISQVRLHLQRTAQLENERRQEAAGED